MGDWVGDLRIVHGVTDFVAVFSRLTCSLCGLSIGVLDVVVVDCEGGSGDGGIVGPGRHEGSKRGWGCLLLSVGICY